MVTPHNAVTAGLHQVSRRVTWLSVCIGRLPTSVAGPACDGRPVRLFLLQQDPPECPSHLTIVHLGVESSGDERVSQVLRHGTEVFRPSCRILIRSHRFFSLRLSVTGSFHPDTRLVKVPSAFNPSVTCGGTTRAYLSVPSVTISVSTEVDFTSR